MHRLAALALFAAILAHATVAQTVAEPAEGDLAYRPVTVFNEHLYRDTMNRPTAVAYDRERHEIWVAETGSGGIGIYRPDGAELFSFTGGTRLQNPGRIAITPDGDLAVLQGNREEVLLFSYRGVPKGSLELEKIGDEPRLSAIAWDRAGGLYVADSASAQIFAYSRSGELRFQFGSRGTEEGQFATITDIAVGDDGLIYVTDARGVAIQVFDQQGNFLRGWGQHSMGAENFSFPSGVAVDSKGRVIASDALRHSVRVFSPEGTILATIGGLGSDIGQLAYPTDVEVDEQDRIIVADRLNSRVQIFAIVAVTP